MAFINNNPRMTGFLYEITPLLKEKFPNRKYCLEYVKDPEIEDWEEISLNILVNFDNEDIEQIFNDVMIFQGEIHESKLKYDLVTKFIMDVESL